ncbi:hypothetical protein GGI15_002259 [Coemansia interrupta]|uniref:[histone H3]-lysine(36) N-trimethyltransferase n=1 Tax=Coemansia interrupta TaxID=1126814 RepID=A0A9W8HJ21_9FUNG|nr:hypothetical protein GGI15_002259 [Coemansia interrupta]
MEPAKTSTSIGAGATMGSSSSAEQSSSLISLQQPADAARDVESELQAVQESAKLPTNDENSDLGGVDVTEAAVSRFENIEKNIFLRGSSEGSKYEESIPCHCRYNSEKDPRSNACGESSDCINRLVQMECNPLTCPCGSYCMNRRFQKRQYAKVRIIDAGRKGYGMQALEDLDIGSFVMEYIGEVVTSSEFRKRASVYQSEGIQHHYFMSIGNNKIIDATRKGCIARFINHSCGPNCVLQKWMVGGAIRMGIFVEKPIKRGEEITFDYKFERMSGSEPQPCYCGSPQCKGIIGVTKERTRKHAVGAGDVDEEVDNVIADIDDEIEDDTVTKHQRDDIRRRHAAVDDEEYGGYSDDGSDLGSDSGNEAGGRGYSDDENSGAVFKHMRRRHNGARGKKSGLTSPEQVLKFVQIMHRSSCQTRIIEILIGKLMETHDRRLLKALIGLQGIGILRTWLQDYKDDDVMLIKILQCISHMPISTRNTIEESRLEDVVKPLCSYSDENVATMASELVERWSTLRHVFKIPKKSRKESATATPASDTPAASRRQSPNRNAENPPIPASKHLPGNGPGDSPGRMRWRSSVNPHSRLRSESPLPGDADGYLQSQSQSQQHQYATHYQQQQQQQHPDASGDTGGWSRRGAGYRGYSPGYDRSRGGRSPSRAHQYGGYRPRYGHQNSRSRSPAHSHRNGAYPSSRYQRSSTAYGQRQNYQSRSRYSSWGGDQQPYAGNGNSRNASMGASNGGAGGYNGPNRPDNTDGNASSSVSMEPQLAHGWKTAYTNEGQPYYYHETTKQTQWEPPLAESAKHKPTASVDAAPVLPAADDYHYSSRNKRINLGLDSNDSSRYSEPTRVASTSSMPGASSAMRTSRSRYDRSHTTNGSPAQYGSSGTDEKVNGVSKARVDEIIERAQRLGVAQSQRGTPDSGSAAPNLSTKGASSSSLQLVTPETDGEPVVNNLARAHAQAEALVRDSAKAPKGGSSGTHTSLRRDSPSEEPSSTRRDKLEKKAQSELAAFVVRAMSKYKSQLGHEEFKHEARKITKVLMEKERKGPQPFDPQKLIELSHHKKTKIKQFVADYMTKLVNRRSDADGPSDMGHGSSSISAPRTPPIPNPTLR